MNHQKLLLLFNNAKLYWSHLFAVCHYRGADVGGTSCWVHSPTTFSYELSSCVTRNKTQHEAAQYHFLSEYFYLHGDETLVMSDNTTIMFGLFVSLK